MNLFNFFNKVPFPNFSSNTLALHLSMSVTKTNCVSVSIIGKNGNFCTHFHHHQGNLEITPPHKNKTSKRPLFPMQVCELLINMKERRKTNHLLLICCTPRWQVSQQVVVKKGGFCGGTTRWARWRLIYGEIDWRCFFGAGFVFYYYESSSNIKINSKFLLNIYCTTLGGNKNFD